MPVYRHIQRPTSLFFERVKHEVCTPRQRAELPDKSYQRYREVHRAAKMTVESAKPVEEIKEGDHVAWNWGAGRVEGDVKEISDSKVRCYTSRGLFSLPSTTWHVLHAGTLLKARLRSR